MDGFTQLFSSLVLTTSSASVEAYDLTPGKWYSFRVYSLKFDNNPRDAYLTFNPDDGGPATFVCYDAQGDHDLPYYIEYTFCANETGTFKFDQITPAERSTTGATWHFYGFTIEETDTPASANLVLTAGDGSFTGTVRNGTITGHPVALTWKGGSGTWNATDESWLDADGQLTTWTNGALAVFTGDAGTVTVDGDIDASISFLTNGYTVAGSFGSHAVSVAAAAGTSNNFAAVTSGAFTKSGSGLVVLNGSASLGGRVVVDGGTLEACVGTCLSASSDVDVAEDAVFQTTASATIGHLSGDGTLVVGSFPQAKVNAFTCDEDSGFSTNKTYTHLYDFGNADSGATINGVNLTAATASSVSATAANGGYSGIPTSGTKDAKTTYLNAANIVSGMGIYDMLRDNRYAHSYTPHLTGLKVGKWHELRIYYTQFEGISATGRGGTISFSPFADGTFRDGVMAYQNARAASYVSYKFQPVKDDLAFKVTASLSDWLIYGLSVELCDAPESDVVLTVTVRDGYETTFNGPVVCAGKLVKAGAGSLRLTSSGTELPSLDVVAGTATLPDGAKVDALDVASGATVAGMHDTSYASPTESESRDGLEVCALTGAGTLRLEGKSDYVSGRFSFVYVTNDASSGFSSSKTYTHLMDFGSGGAATVNGVTIPAYTNNVGVSLSNPSGANVSGCSLGSNSYDWSTQGGLTSYISSSEGVFDLYRDFKIFGGNGPWTFHLYNLQAGKWHEFRWYQRAPTGSLCGGRVVKYLFDPDNGGPQSAMVTMSQNSYKPHYLAYRFYAATNNCFTFSIYNTDPKNGAHIYGFSCEVIDDPTGSETGVVSVASGDFSGSVAGTNDWFKTGTNTLTLSGTSPFSGTAVVSGGTLLAQNAAFTEGSVQIDECGTFGVARGASASVGGNFTVSNGGTMRYEAEQGSKSGAVAVAGDTSLAETGTVDVVTSLSLPNIPSRNDLVVTQGTTSEPASFAGWKTLLNSGDEFTGALKVEDGTFRLYSGHGLVIILK